MKKFVICFLSGLACVSSVTGCLGQSEQAEGLGPEPISAEMLAQDVYDALQEEWDSYDSLSTEQKMLSSHFPGAFYEDFCDWVACEEFLGISIPNPLEEAAWLSHGTYVGMPEGFQDAPNVRVNLYGTREGHVEWLSVESGYRDGEIRVTLDAMLYSDLAENKSPDSGWSVELERQSYLANVDDNPVLITEDSGEQYVSCTAYLAHGHVLYRVSVIGNPNLQDHVQETLENALSEFENV